MKRYLLLIIINFLFINCDSKKEGSIELNNKIADSDFTFSTWTGAGNTFNKKNWEKKISYYDSLGLSEILVGGSPEILRK